MTMSAKRKQLVYDWIETVEEERQPESEFRKSHKISYRTMKNMKIDWQTDQMMETKRDIQVKGAFTAIEEQLNSPDIIVDDDDRWVAVENSIYKRALEGNTKAQELYAKLKKKLKEEVNLTVGLSADEITRRNLQAARELGGEGGHRVAEVQNESSLLSE